MKTDARVRYTKMRIREAFFGFLAEKPLSRITVKEMCETAEINRATFYKHYADPYDLMERIEQECLCDLRSFIEKSAGASGIEITTRMLNGLRDQGWQTLLLCGPNGDPDFPHRIAEVLYEQYLPNIAGRLPNRSEEEQKAAYQFLFGGSDRLLSGWMKNGMQEPPDQIVRQLLDLCDTFLRAYGPQS